MFLENLFVSIDNYSFYNIIKCLNQTIRTSRMLDKTKIHKIINGILRQINQHNQFII